MIATLFHADWGKSERKRWVSVAKKQEGVWKISAPSLVVSSNDLLERMFSTLADGSTVAGFDFPIGLPRAYGEQTGLGSFCNAISKFGGEGWTDFYNVASDRSEVSITRPFYPQAPGGKKQAHLFMALNVSSMRDLLRQCEKATDKRRAASSLFWTLGGSQVGKAAISGWQEIVVPARRRGAKLWPFECRFGEMSVSPCLTICETYPAEAYRHLSLMSGRGSKQSPAIRAAQGPLVVEWGEKQNVLFDNECRQSFLNGFSHLGRAGEDAFDSLVGLLSMIDVAEGRRYEGNFATSDVGKWEGWILGQN